MLVSPLSITALPAWSKLNDVSFLDIKVATLGASKGFGLVTEKALTSRDVVDIPTLLEIPKELVLSAEFIDEHMKVDKDFRELRKLCGGKSIRADVMLFLLTQITMADSTHGRPVGLSNPWTEYVRMLPSEIPVPTMWSEAERVFLVGTSLEAAVNAKVASLVGEFDTLREKTARIPWCQRCWWEKDVLGIRDWFLLDAWWRSRSLELPMAGESMIPCIDMVNHSFEANSYYEEKAETGVALLLRPDMKLAVGSEITISYGVGKSEAEMLFNYGFIDGESAVGGLTLALEPFPDDPLGKAKAAAFSGSPTVRIFKEQDKIHWASPFLYLMCLNEEDGLDFKVLQQTDGSRGQLRIFWQEADVTESTTMFESLIEDHDLKDVFKLRVVALLQDRIRQQIERIYGSEDAIQSLVGAAHGLADYQRYALQLRGSETGLLEGLFTTLEVHKSQLLEKESVLRYLGWMEGEKSPEQEDTNDEEDFS